MVLTQVSIENVRIDDQSVTIVWDESTGRIVVAGVDEWSKAAVVLGRLGVAVQVGSQTTAIVESVQAVDRVESHPIVDVIGEDPSDEIEIQQPRVLPPETLTPVPRAIVYEDSRPQEVPAAAESPKAKVVGRQHVKPADVATGTGVSAKATAPVKASGPKPSGTGGDLGVFCTITTPIELVREFKRQGVMSYQEMMARVTELQDAECCPFLIQCKPEKAAERLRTAAVAEDLDGAL